MNEFSDRQTMLLLLNECIDLRVNLMRLELSGWWDEILKNMFDAGACTHYRVLVEHWILLIFTDLAKTRTRNPN